MKYKLLALDMDGTLLNKDKIITPKTEKALLDAQKAGLKVAIASGRMPLGVQKYSEQLQLKKYSGYLMCFNGGLLMDAQGKVIHKQYIDKKYLYSVCDFLSNTDITVVIHRYDGLFANSNKNDFTYIAPKTVNAPLTQLENLPEYATWNFYKILLVGVPEKLKEIKPQIDEKYGNELEIVFSAPWFLELMPKGVDKGTALKILSEKTGISLSEMIACGDNFNDRTMLETAGFSVVMANGVDEMKQLADYVTHNDCDNDGIAEVVKKLI